jgi:hypothetical protein
MSTSQSYLSSPEYGYDYVVAVTQDSINATALDFLSHRQPILNVCFISDDNGDPLYIDYEAFKRSANGADPFNIPASGPEREKQLANLDNALFMYGFQAAMGLPEGFPVDKLPDIVTLGATAKDPAIYRLLCKRFLLVQLNQIRHRKPVFETFAQPKGPQGDPWIFTYQVGLLNEPVKDNKAFLKTPVFGNLPAGVQSKLTENPEDFTIQHLLFDFNHAASDVRPTIPGLNRKLEESLHEDFAIKYFTEMKATGSPVVAVTPASNNPFAGLKTEFSVNPSLAQPKLATLNYLCSTAGHQLPPAKPFTWNWVQPGAGDDIDGVCVINRSDLVENFKSQLAPYVEQNKWLPQPTYVEVYLTSYKGGFGVVGKNYDWHGEYPNNLNIDTDKLEAPLEGDLLLHWQFQASREYDYLSGTSWMRGVTSFDLKVSCAGNTLTVEQHAWVFCKLVMVTFDRHEWNLVDLTITDTFTLAAKSDGTLTANRTTKTTDKSSQITGDFAVPDLYRRFRDTQTEVRNNIKSSFVDIPLSFVNNVIFPGGKGFLFKDVAFSDHQDLVAHITYKG